MRILQFFIFAQIFLVVQLLGATSLFAAEKQAESIDELVAMFDDAKCMECHEEIHAQWKNSWYAKAVISSLKGMHNFIAIGLAKEWKPL